MTRQEAQQLAGDKIKSVVCVDPITGEDIMFCNSEGAYIVFNSDTGGELIADEGRAE